MGRGGLELRTGRTDCGSADGFTLVEALVAVAVFGVGIASLMPMVVANVRANSAAAVRSQAVAVCQAKLEEFGAFTYDEVLAYPTSGSKTLNEAGEEVTGGIFTYTWSIAAPPGPPEDQADMRRITAQVTWSLPSRPSGEVTFVTARTRY